MTAIKTRLGTNEDGTPLHHYTPSDPSLGLVITNHATGLVTLADGTVYDVTEDVIEAPVEHHGEISHLIGVKHETEGHPKYDPEIPYVHECTDHCGAAARKAI